MSSSSKSNNIREYSNVTFKGETVPGTLVFNDRKLMYHPGSDEGSKLKVKWSRVIDCKMKRKKQPAVPSTVDAIDNNNKSKTDSSQGGGGGGLRILLDDEQVLVFLFSSKQDLDDAINFTKQQQRSSTSDGSELSQHSSRVSVELGDEQQQQQQQDESTGHENTVKFPSMEKAEELENELRKTKAELNTTKNELNDLRTRFRAMESDMDRVWKLLKIPPEEREKQGTRTISMNNANHNVEHQQTESCIPGISLQKTLTDMGKQLLVLAATVSGESSIPKNGVQPAIPTQTVQYYDTSQTTAEKNTIPLDDKNGNKKDTVANKADVPVKNMSEPRINRNEAMQETKSIIRAQSPTTEFAETPMAQIIHDAAVGQHAQPSVAESNATTTNPQQP